ncbi:effector-associated constant component EACC1 [Actinomadura macra]|uniref:effector-associated constant component EACC1 n=1 Tax=Actinomadura macra TaxID=46164 RepID=UPI00083433B0|nr:hypothetical protein [Actinomadura macra]
MEIRLRLDGDDGRELLSLYRWLRQDPDVTRNGRVSLVPTASRPGEMGGAYEAVSAQIGHVIALAGLIIAYRGWSDTRRKDRRPVARIERDGVAVELEGASADDVRRVAQALGMPDEPR